MYMPINIRNRVELRETLQQSLLSISETDEETKPERMFKGFIIESNVPSPLLLKEQQGFEVNTTDETSLNLLRVGENLFYIDSLDPRFWLVYTSERSNEATSTLRKIIEKENSLLDGIWFSSKGLSKILSLGKSVGFGIKYENKFVEGSDEYLDTMSMQVRGGRPERILNMLKTNPDTKDGVRLSKVGLQYKSIKTDIYYSGKFVINKGGQIDEYFDLLNNIKDKYKSSILKIEENNRIGIVRYENSFSLKGEVITIEFSKRLEDLEKFIGIIFSGNKPFRVLGIKYKLEDGYYKVYGIDMHSYHKITFEITSDYIRIYLGKHSCGNIITRLFANLEQYFQPNIKIFDGQNEQII